MNLFRYFLAILICKNCLIKRKLFPSWVLPLVLNFDDCALGHPRQLRIGGVIRDYNGVAVRAFSKQVRDVLAFLQALLQARVLRLSNLLVKGDSYHIVILVAKLKRGPLSYYGWLCQILYVSYLHIFWTALSLSLLVELIMLLIF